MAKSRKGVVGKIGRGIPDFHITRPQIPEVLYLHYNGEVVEMTRSEDNPYLSLTEVSDSEEGYPMELSGKLSTTASLDDAKLIWELPKQAIRQSLLKRRALALLLITGIGLSNKSLSM